MSDVITELPSATLEAAADLVLQLAGHFEGYEGGPEGDDRFGGSPVREWTYWSVDRQADAAARAWIATMSPAVADSLAALLRASTGYWRLYENRGWPQAKVRSQVGEAALQALALSEVILGSRSMIVPPGAGSGADLDLPALNETPKPGGG